MIPRIVFFIAASLLISFNLLSSRAILASNGQTCDNRFVTLVNPVRGRNLWIDKTINPLKDQYNLAKEYKVPVTWLLQYDALVDEEILKETKKFDPSHEIGVFLEVSPDYAQKARVIYPHAVPWFSPRAVFLSGYSQSQRRSLIDKLFSEFKIKYGFYPKSVGAWWIDAGSLVYMKEKYGIVANMDVADQYSTDNYQVWGQYFSTPYYPDRDRVINPAQSEANKIPVVIT
ncbi:MAG: hypothetical protein Q8Q86_02670, partial [Candidatus Daviesbacteria bacterium]|nr:hypothetical protein [Candidatus Daviesbacteria bacterium]